MFARIALLSAPYSTLTYALPDIFPEEFWQEGLRVAIPLGRGALRAGILMERLEHSDLPDGVTCKEVAWPLETVPLLSEEIRALARDLAIRQGLFLQQDPRILDLCCGSGCIGLALASQLKDARVTLADLSPKALKVAKKNAADLRLTGRVSCFQADAFVPADKFLGQFDLIISNPPYVTTEDMKTLQRSVRDYEPHMALDGGEDGLDFYRAIAENYTSALKPGGFLALEFGMGQEDDVCRILERFDYEILRLKEDTGHITRAVLAKKKSDNAL